MARPRRTHGPDTRERLLTAATAEFASFGLDGASLDRIARGARVTKAMVYYHFASKLELYREIIKSTVQNVGDRVTAIQRSERPASSKLTAFVEVFAEEALKRPEFPRMMLREVTDQGRHFDADTAKLFGAVPAAFMAILEEGVRQGEFRRMNPLVGYFAVVGPIVLFSASVSARARLSRIGAGALPVAGQAELVQDVQALAVAMLSRSPVESRPSEGVVHARSQRTPDRRAGVGGGGRPARRRLS